MITIIKSLFADEEFQIQHDLPVMGQYSPIQVRIFAYIGKSDVITDSSETTAYPTLVRYRFIKIHKRQKTKDKRQETRDKMTVMLIPKSHEVVSKNIDDGMTKGRYLPLGVSFAFAS